MSMFSGDMKEVRKLRGLYNLLLLEKEKFVDTMSRESLTAEQRTEAEVGLAKITGDLKRIDLGIQQMVFGGDWLPECDAISILRIVEMQYDSEVQNLRTETQKLRSENIGLKASNSALRFHLQHKKENAAS